MPLRLRQLYRYPVKGLSAEPLDAVTLAPGAGLPHDRRFALARPGCRFDPERPEWLPKTEFFMLMQDERLAALATRFDAGSGTLTARHQGRAALEAPITEAEGRADAERFFAGFLGVDGAEGPRIVEAPGHSFTDASQRPGTATYRYVSLINLASIDSLGREAGVALDPLRFRANVYFDGLPAWAELDWTGREISLGAARLRVASTTTRCAATSVNPATAERDLNVPVALRRAFGHILMGVYAEVVAGGGIAPGMEGRVSPAA